MITYVSENSEIIKEGNREATREFMDRVKGRIHKFAEANDASSEPAKEATQRGKAFFSALTGKEATPEALREEGADTFKLLDGEAAPESIEGMFAGMATLMDAYACERLIDAAEIAAEEPRSYFRFPYSRLSGCMDLDFIGVRTLTSGYLPASMTADIEAAAGGNFEAWREAVKQISRDFDTLIGNPDKDIPPVKLTDEQGRRFAWGDGGEVNLIDLAAWYEDIAYRDIAEGTGSTVEEARQSIRLGDLDLRDPQAQYIAICGLCALGFEKRLREVLRPTKPEVENKYVVFNTSRVEDAIFNPADKDYIGVEDYNGEKKAIATGKGMIVQLALALDYSTQELDSMTMAERALMQLAGTEKFWLTGFHSVVHDNMGEARVYGSDILKKWGYRNVYRDDMADTMESAANAIYRCTKTDTLIDTTGEEQKYAKRGKVLKSVQCKPIVDGKVSFVEHEVEDGETVRDFYVDLNVKEGESVISALPTFEYAQSKEQLITVDSSVFDFGATTDAKGKPLKGVRQVNAEHRQMMAYIYKQIKSKGMSNTIRLETMFRACGFDKGNTEKALTDKKYRMTSMMAKLLDHWQARGIIKMWTFGYEGRKKATVTVIPSPKKLAK